MSFTYNYDEDSDLYLDDCVLLKKEIIFSQIIQILIIIIVGKNVL